MFISFHFIDVTVSAGEALFGLSHFIALQQ